MQPLSYQPLDFIQSVWTKHRSITGNGLRETLKAIKSIVPELKITEVVSGTKIWDWEVPKEWVFRSAYVKKESMGGESVNILDTDINNLHVINYSAPINKILSLDELSKKLISIPDMPTAIPYRTSYYSQDWGFCIADNHKKTLSAGNYHAVIDTEFINGAMSMGEIFFQGKVKSEILFTTYVCHPMMANNELSGPAVAISLANYLKNNKTYYSYRIIFAPETIGTLYFLSQNLDHLRQNLVAGYVLTCLGDNLTWSYMPSRTGISISDKIAKRVLKKLNINFCEYTFLDRGSDERQYCSPRVDLPVCSVMRSKYGTYPQYHTSEDNLDFISEEGLNGSIDFYIRLIAEFESNRIPVAETFGEPMYSKRDMRSKIGGGKLTNNDFLYSNIMAYADGSNDLYELSAIFNQNLSEINEASKILEKNRLIKFR